MGQRHKYEYQVYLDSGSAAARVVRMVGSDKRVLEIGAGPGSITRALCQHGNCRVTAVELDAAAIERLSPYCERVHRFDLNDGRWTSVVSAEGRFQVIVAADVLEHLRDPRATLAAFKDLLAADGYIVVSLPHIGHNAVLASLADEDFAYQDWGLLDRTHVWFFGIRNMQQLFDDAGYEIVGAEFVVRAPSQTEFARKWLRAPRELRRALSRNRFGYVYQVVIKARPRSAGGEGIALIDLPVDRSRRRFPSGTPLRARLVDVAKRFVVPWLSPRTRLAIRKLLDRLGVKY